MITIMSALAEFLVRLGGQDRVMPAGTALFRRGDPVAWVFWVRDGAARLLRRGEAGRTLVLQTALAGAVLAEASLFSATYHCDGEAVTETRLRPIPLRAVRDALTADPDFAAAWMRHLAAEAQAARMRAEILSLRTVAERLDVWLDWRDGALPGRGAWRDLAAELGVTPESLYRELARRRDRGRPA
jgi:CRP-like cAMP-binding protein